MQDVEANSSDRRRHTGEQTWGVADEEQGWEEKALSPVEHMELGMFDRHDGAEQRHMNIVRLDQLQVEVFVGQKG